MLSFKIQYMVLKQGTYLSLLMLSILQIYPAQEMEKRNVLKTHQISLGEENTLMWIWSYVRKERMPHHLWK